MEFLFSLLLWIFGADATAAKPIVYDMKSATHSTISVAPTQGEETNLNSIESAERIRISGNTRIRHTIIIFEDTHFRMLE